MSQKSLSLCVERWCCVEINICTFFQTYSPFGIGPTLISARIRQWNSAWQHMFVWGQRPHPVTQRGPYAAKFLGLSYVSDLWESTFLRTQAHPYQNGRGHSAPSFRTLQLCALIITLRTKLSGAVYCNRSSLFVCLFVCGSVTTITWNLRASIFTKLGL